MDDCAIFQNYLRLLDAKQIDHRITTFTY